MDCNPFDYLTLSDDNLDLFGDNYQYLVNDCMWSGACEEDARELEANKLSTLPSHSFFNIFGLDENSLGELDNDLDYYDDEDSPVSSDSSDEHQIISSNSHIKDHSYDTSYLNQCEQTFDRIKGEKYVNGKIYLDESATSPTSNHSKGTTTQPIKRLKSSSSSAVDNGSSTGALKRNYSVSSDYKVSNSCTSNKKVKHKGSPCLNYVSNRLKNHSESSNNSSSIRSNNSNISIKCSSNLNTNTNTKTKSESTNINSNSNSNKSNTNNNNNTISLLGSSDVIVSGTKISQTSIAVSTLASTEVAATLLHSSSQLLPLSNPSIVTVSSAISSPVSPIATTNLGLTATNVSPTTTTTSILKSSSKARNPKSLYPERRKEHNNSEKKRRDHLRNAFNHLKDQIPKLKDGEKKAARVTILKEATSYVTLLKDKHSYLERTKKAELTKKENLLKRLKTLQAGSSTTSSSCSLTSVSSSSISSCSNSSLISYNEDSN